MSDQTPQESGQAESEELPTPSFSQPDASQTNSDADAIVSKLTPILEQLVDRKVQSVKDKRFSEIEKVLGGRSKLLAELEASGVEISKDVRSELRMRDLEEQLSQQPARPTQVSDAGPSQQRQAVTEAVAELTRYGLSSNDPQFIELLRGQYSNPDAFKAKVTGYVLGKVAPQPPPSPAGLVQSPAASTSKGNDVGPLIAELSVWQKEPTKYKAQIAQRVKDLNERGWN